MKTCPPWRIRGYEISKIFENFVPQFPKKEVNGSLGKSVPSLVFCLSNSCLLAPKASGFVVTEEMGLKGQTYTLV